MNPTTLLALALDGQTWPELGKLFAIFGGLMVVLYILKLRRRRVQVPFSPLWARVVVERQSSSLFKALKRVGSLLVQLAIIALVIFALGDPQVSGSFLGCTHEEEKPPPPRHALIVLDASASMSTVEGGRRRIERAVEEARAVIAALAVHPTQKVMVVQLDNSTRPLTLWTSNQSTLEQALDRYGHVDGDRRLGLDTPTAIADALELAEDALRGREGAEVILITDRAFEPLDPSKIETLGLRVIPVGVANDNIGIESFNVRPYLDDSVTYVAWYAVHNEAEREVRAHLHLYAAPGGVTESDFEIAGALVHTEPLVLPPKATLKGQVAELKFPGSRLMARVVIDKDDTARDAFARDDVAFAVVPERKILKVQLVSEGNLFVHAALFLRENIALTTVTPSEYQGPEGFDVTVVDAVDVDVSRPGSYFLVEPRSRDGFATTGVLAEPLVHKTDKKHPLSRHLSFADANILETPVYALQKGDEVVASAQNGVPLLFTRRFADGRRAVVLAFDVKKSLLPMNYSFPILVVNAISWFALDPDGLLKPNRAGEPISLPYPGRATTFETKGPGPIAVRKVGERVHFTAPRLGIYELNPTTRSEDDKPLAVAVNLLSPDESRISPRGEYPAWVAPTYSPPVKNAWLADFWRVLLLAALAVVLIEWFTWHRRWTV
jgi:Ca-activated chloride channel family protein